MTTPWPDPPGTPEPRTEFASGSAMYTGQPHDHCRYCGKRAEVWDLDGSWCSDECQRNDRQSEVTWWRKAVAS